jgi:hypothetical protein
MLAQGWKRSDNPGLTNAICRETLKGFANRLTLSGLRHELKFYSQGSRDARTLGSN